nr:response regulator [Azospirillum soli]
MLFTDVVMPGTINTRDVARQDQDFCPGLHIPDGLMPRPAARHTVLLVEDDALVRLTTVEMLKELGHEVMKADDAAGALAILEAEKITVLVTDVGLPGMSGSALSTLWPRKPIVVRLESRW